jgi:lipoprotein-anchoring transpeptidase ErfK/SrfK
MTGVDGLRTSMATAKLEPLKARDRCSRWFWRIAVLAAAGAIGVASQAEATIYWPDSDLGFSQPAPETVSPAPRRKPIRRGQPQQAIETPGKQAAKPHGALVIAISINQQNMKIYDANGFFAETPISTGMSGHPTPMGVFSVVQKQRLHHSNIYSGAPMPFMQRITWSGIAIHAGVLPGYPASHGCIRMPMAFAVRMYGWTRMGARVVITPDEVVPTGFSHPLLAAQKIVPQPMAADEPKADKAPNVVTTKPATSEASLELRSTVGHADSAKSMTDASASARLREQTRTADAGAFPKSPVVTSDATPSGDAPIAEAETGTAKLEPARLEVEPVTAERAEIASLDDKAVGAKSSLARSSPAKSWPAEIKSADTDADRAGTKPDQTVKPNDSVKPVTDITTSVPDQKNEAPAAKPDAATLTAPKRTGQIAVFISRKDSKLYVRQNFAPLFDVPVTIAPSDRPLGTHVFTAEVDKDDANVVHWSVVSLPAPTRNAERRDEDERAARRRKMAGAVKMEAAAPEPDSPAEALDRLTIPEDARARIAEALSTGSSIIVSDQGIAGGETGEGTDFIVSLR